MSRSGVGIETMGAPEPRQAERSGSSESCTKLDYWSSGCREKGITAASLARPFSLHNSLTRGLPREKIFSTLVVEGSTDFIAMAVSAMGLCSAEAKYEKEGISARQPRMMRSSMNYVLMKDGLWKMSSKLPPSPLLFSSMTEKMSKERVPSTFDTSRFEPLVDFSQSLGTDLLQQYGITRSLLLTQGVLVLPWGFGDFLWRVGRLAMVKECWALPHFPNSISCSVVFQHRDRGLGL